MTITTVVVGIDGSEAALRALGKALELVDKAGTVHVVTAYDAPSNSEWHQAYASIPKEFLGNIDLLAGEKNSMRAAVRAVTAHGVDVAEHLVDDDPAAAILGVAKVVDADLIVVGSRGRGRMSQVLRGSVSTKIAHHSPVDFMVVH